MIYLIIVTETKERVDTVTDRREVRRNNNSIHLNSLDEVDILSY